MQELSTARQYSVLQIFLAHQQAVIAILFDCSNETIQPLPLAPLLLFIDTLLMSAMASKRPVSAIQNLLVNVIAAYECLTACF